MWKLATLALECGLWTLGGAGGGGGGGVGAANCTGLGFSHDLN